MTQRTWLARVTRGPFYDGTFGVVKVTLCAGGYCDEVTSAAAVTYRNDAAQFWLGDIVELEAICRSPGLTFPYKALRIVEKANPNRGVA